MVGLFSSGRVGFTLWTYEHDSTPIGHRIIPD